jgi:hypothetical protein
MFFLRYIFCYLATITLQQQQLTSSTEQIRMDSERETLVNLINSCSGFLLAGCQTKKVIFTTSR